MLHLIDGFMVFVLIQFLQAPVLPHAGMQEILVDHRQFILEHLVKVLDYFLVTLHNRPPKTSYGQITSCHLRVCGEDRFAPFVETVVES